MNRQSGWKRHRAWALLLGGVALLGVGLLVADSAHQAKADPQDPTQQALERARRSPEVLAALGAPFAPRESDFTQGDGEGFSTLDQRVELQGPRGQGRLRIKALYSSGSWHFSVLDVELATGTVNLLAPPANGR
jgi:hypothetical protein